MGRYVGFDGHVVVVRPVAEVGRGGALGAVPVVLVPVRLHAAEEEGNECFLRFGADAGAASSRGRFCCWSMARRSRARVRGDLCAA